MRQHDTIGNNFDEAMRRAQRKATAVVARISDMKLRAAAEVVRQKIAETLTYFAYPTTHWGQLRTNNPLERIIREVRRETGWSGHFLTATRRTC